MVVKAVNHWVEYSRGLEPNAFPPQPLTSKDLDLLGHRGVVKQIGKMLGVEPYIPRQDDVTPESGHIKVLMADGRELKIDFLNDSMPNTQNVIKSTMVGFQTEEGRFFVMHPAQCLKSRVHNVMNLPGYDNPHGIGQMVAAIKVVPIFCQSLLDQGAEKAEQRVMAIYNDLFKYSRTRVPKKLWKEKQINTFDAVKPLRGMNREFAAECYPRWLRTVGRVNTGHILGAPDP